MSQIHPLIKLLSDYKPMQNARLTWPEYFISQALITSFRSPSKKLQVGAVIVKGNRVISTGYNGYFPGVPHISVHVENHEVNTVHAEQNAIADAAKRGVSIDQSTLYVTHYPCINCAKMIIASGIKTVVYLNDYKCDEITNQLFQEAEVNITKFTL